MSKDRNETGTYERKLLAVGGHLASAALFAEEDLIMFNWLGSISILQSGRSRAVNAENPTGEKGCGGIAASKLGPSRKGSPCLQDLAPGSVTTLADIEGPGIIRHIWMTVADRTTDADCFVLRDLVLRFYWEDAEKPAVECPLGDFFCCGFANGAFINSVPVTVCPNRGMNMYFPMPFGKRARITLTNQHANPIPAFFYQVDFTLLDELPDNSGYFHSQWRRQRLTEKSKDYVVLDKIKGRGQYVGTYLALTTLERYWWGEGEFKFYLDGDQEYPTICGTGTEDYFGGAWSFAKQVNGYTIEQNYCTPYLGYPLYASKDGSVHNPYHNDDTPPMRSLYRWHLPDPILFSQDIRVTLQQIGVCHRGLFERQDDVASTAYWYLDSPHGCDTGFLPVEDRWPR